MPALATLKELNDVYKKIRTLKKQHPKACKAMVALLSENRRIGYNNICKMFLEEATPKKLKEQ